MMSERSLRVCYFGTYRQNYSRNLILIAGLRRNGVTVTECHETLWQGIDDRVDSVNGGWKKPAFWSRIVRTYSRLLRRYWALRHDYDILVVGYPGQFDVYLARLLSWWQGKPLVWDVFMSIYLIAVERGLDQDSALAVNLLRGVEWLACRLPNRLILDTAEYVKWFHHTHGVNAARFRLVPTGADSDQFAAVASDGAESRSTSSDSCRVIYYGTFIPNHGVLTIVEAARHLVAEPTIQLELIGQGPDRAAAEALAQEYQLPNLTFTDWLAKDALVKRVAHATIVLGAFGTTPQSLMTVQNKIYEGLALGKPVLSGDGPAVRAALRADEEIILCPRNDGAALADAIRRLCKDAALRSRVAAQGQQRFSHDYALAPLGKRFKTHLLEVANRS